MHRPHRNAAPNDHPSYERALGRRIRLLTSLLARALKAQAGAEVSEAMAHLQQAVEDIDQLDDRGQRQCLIDAVEGLSPDAYSQVVRAFTLYFSAINIAEETTGLSLRRRQAIHRGHFWEDSFHDTLLTLQQQGMGSGQVQVLLDRLLYMPVLTAHPTEAKRRTLKSALREVFLTVEELDDPRVKGYYRQQTVEKLYSQIEVLWKTDEVRAHRLSVEDEVAAGLFYFPLSLFEATCQVYRNFGQSLADVYGEGVLRLPSFLRFGSWIGGDRDGNPYVTPEMTALAVRMQAATILTEYRRRLDRLLGELSHSYGLCQPSAEFLQSLDSDRELLGDTAALAKPFYEPRAVKYRKAVGYKFFALLLFLSCFKRLRRLEIRSSPASPPCIDPVAACLGAVRLHLLSVLSLVPAPEPAC